MKLVTWNVNSIKAREERVLAFLARERPDVLCMQELKVVDEKFPSAAFEALGYQAAVYGEKTYNGVAIVAKHEISDIRQGIGDGVQDPQARVLRVRVCGIEVVTVYVPNGQSVGSEKYRYKMRWLDRVHAMLRKGSPGDPLIICGDFNIATDERDVSKPAAWAQSVLFHPEVRAKLQALLDWGLTDTFRLHNPDGRMFSWWDYRGPMWRQAEGLNIDHTLATAPMLARCLGSRIDKQERDPKLGGDTKPSDHAPVIAEFED